jgi:hypothetical protein
MVSENKFGELCASKKFNKMMSGNIQNIMDKETAESPRQGHPFHRTHTAEEGAGGELEKV